jgi:hypothetical protein
MNLRLNLWLKTLETWWTRCPFLRCEKNRAIIGHDPIPPVWFAFSSWTLPSIVENARTLKKNMEDPSWSHFWHSHINVKKNISEVFATNTTICHWWNQKKNSDHLRTEVRCLLHGALHLFSLQFTERRLGSWLCDSRSQFDIGKMGIGNVALIIVKLHNS